MKTKKVLRVIKVVFCHLLWLVKWVLLIAGYVGVGIVLVVLVMACMGLVLPCMFFEVYDRIAWKRIEHRENQMKAIFGRGSGIRIKYRDY